MAQGENKITQAEINRAEQVLPMWKIILSQFFEHKAAVISLIVISLYLLIAIFAPAIKMILDIDPETQNPLSRYQTPGSTTIATAEQREDIINNWQKNMPELTTQLAQHLVDKKLTSTTDTKESLLEFAKKDLSDLQPLVQQLNPEFQTPVTKILNSFKTYHIFGTDELGRDVLMRLVYGTQVSIGVGLLVTLASAFLGLLIGAFAGYYGGAIDSILMRITDALLSIPQIPIMILFAAVDLDKIPGARLIITTQNQNVLKLVVILIIFSWMTVARLVRGSVLSLREREFILAAKTMGATDNTIIFRHLFPNVVAPLLVSVTLGVGSAILSEAALSFLGLGIQPPTPSWGNMLFNASELINEAPALAFLPGLNILIVVMCFNYLGDGLQDAIDPKAIRR